MGVYGQRFNASGAPQGGEFRVNSSTTGNQDAPSIGMATDGSFVVVFTDYNSNSGDIFVQRYNASGGAVGGNVRVNTLTTNVQEYASVAVSPGGAFVVVWESEAQDGTLDGVYAQRYDAAGAVQGGEFRVNTTIGGDEQNVAVAIDTAGNFVVVWDASTSDPGSNTGIYGQRYNAAGAAQGGEFRINTTTADTQQIPSVAMNASGGFVVAWQSNLQDGGSSGVYTQQFSAAGTALGPETLVNTTTTNAQVQPSVAYAGNRVVVAWSGNGTGDAGGVFAQRFNVVAGITTGNTSAAMSSSAGASSLTWSHTVASGSNGMLIVNVAVNSDVGVSSVSYGGTALTRLGTVTNPGGSLVTSEIWYLAAPAVGTANVVVTLAGSDTLAAGATNFYGVDQTTPFGTFVSATGSGGAPTVNVTSAAGEVVVDAAVFRARNTATVGAGQTQLWVQGTGTSGSDTAGAGSTEAGAATVTMSWTSSGSGTGEWATGAVALRPAPMTGGITVTPAVGALTTEAGGTATFSVVLATAPTADVTITVSSSDTSEATVSTALLTFTSANWNTAQTVTVTGVDDALADGFSALLDRAGRCKQR